MTEDEGAEENEPDFEARPPRRRDRKIDEAKTVLLGELFVSEPERVFYERQIEVLYERRFYHWITGRALGELVAEGKVGSALVPLVGATKLRFYWSRKLRYWKRQADEITALVARYSKQEFTRALGPRFPQVTPEISPPTRRPDVRRS